MPEPMGQPTARKATPWGLRTRAAEFRHLAQTARDEVIHVELLRLAEAYLEDADLLDRGAVAALSIAG
jgi:hypothetical protein